VTVEGAGYLGSPSNTARAAHRPKPHEQRVNRHAHPDDPRMG
jgi:hypothetical protein